MKTDIKPLNEITNQANHLLYRELGVVNTIRFLNQFTTGHGNYTEEREQLSAEQFLNDVICAFKQRRGK